MRSYNFGRYTLSNWYDSSLFNWGSSYLSNFWNSSFLGSSSWLSNIWNRFTSTTSQQTPVGNSSSEGDLTARNFPTEFELLEDTTTALDFSSTKLRYSGKNRDELTIEIAAVGGILEAEGTKKVTVSGSGTDTLTLTGRRSQLDKYLNDKKAITFTGDSDLSGDNAGSISLTHVKKSGDKVVIGKSDVDITDTPDTVEGTEQNDTLDGDQGVNTIDGLGGDDEIEGGASGDVLIGGAGTDWLKYEGSDAGVSIDLNTDASGNQSASGGDAEGDTISEFENVRGSGFDDLIVGDEGGNYMIGGAGTDTITGNGGDDTIRGGEGADLLDGGAGVDILQYEGSAAGVFVDLNGDASGFQSVSGGDAEGDTVSGFEDVFGSDSDDFIVGNAGENYLIGFLGDDNIDGGAGDDVIRGGVGADTLEGGDGVDLLQYFTSTSGITIDLGGNAPGTGGDAEGDVVSGFENVYGSDHGDNITGDAGRNVLFGYDGDDTLDGGAGNDTIRGDEGADRLEGGDGIDWLRYNGSTAAVTVDLNADANGLQSASGGTADGDVISGFENVYGTRYDDTFTGDENANIFYGGGGADTFIFNTALGNGNVDRIVDFRSGTDVMHLDSAVFSGLAAGALDADAFLINATGDMETGSNRISYESDTGYLRFDADGTGDADSVIFGRLRSGLTLDEDDFFIF